MPRPPRRINDAQVERLLDAMGRGLRDQKSAEYKQALAYRQALARRTVEKEGHAPGTADYQRRYKSTMRRFERYVTDAGERRNFANAPKEIQRDVRATARAVPIPPVRRPLPPPQEPPPTERPPRRREPGEMITYEPVRPTYEPSREINLNDLRAITAYYDGDINEAISALGLTARAARLYDLAVSGHGVDILGMQGSGEIADAARELLSLLPDSDIDDINDFHDLLMNLPDWQIAVMMGDLEDGNTTFSDWMTAWRATGMDIYAEENEFYILWREAYKRAKA